MTISRKALCVTYAAIGVVAFICTWGNVLGVVGAEGFWSGTIHFWQDTLVNPASRFITIDILFLGLAVIIWMLLEARRLRIRGVWLYVIGGLLFAISLTVPLFLIHRERKLAALEPNAPAGTLTTSDAVGLGVLGSIIAVYSLIALFH